MDPQKTRSGAMRRIEVLSMLSAVAMVAGTFALWDEGVPLPSPDELAYPDAAVDVVVNRADPEYQFLHDNAVAWYGDTLFAAWYNCPKGEIQDSSCIRARRSRDNGRSWSDPEIVAADRQSKGIFYVPVALFSHEGQLSAFVSTMVGHDLVTHCELFDLDEAKAQWVSKGYVAGPFIANCPPIPMDDGNYIMAGRMTRKAATTPEVPAVAISVGKDVTRPWELVPMTKADRCRPYSDFPESTVWVDGPEVTAVVRGGLVFVSKDYGRNWTGPFRHNLPAEDSKPFALQLSTGQRCLLWNYPEAPETSRRLLAIAVGRPGAKTLSAMWQIRRGDLERLQVGPEWSYPCAVEHEGVLYIVYTSQKKHSVMTSIPLKSLAAGK
jgi:hypothetical protein